MKPTDVEFLYRQSEGVVIQSNISEFEQYISKINTLREQDKERHQLKTRMADVESSLSEIKNMLLELTNVIKHR
jgi:Tfp pilus assembly protein PilN